MSLISFLKHNFWDDCVASLKISTCKCLICCDLWVIKEQSKLQPLPCPQRFSPADDLDRQLSSDENENILKSSDADEESILVADYHSDEETRTSCDSDEEEGEEGEPHVTKVTL